ncbi:DUF393 domain-containing protein [bacterium]|nr:DUF393 domain-containing protein [bacterium]
MAFELSVYYDGLCHLCSREIEFYQKLEHGKNIEWIDISSPSFSAESLGLDPKALEFYLHARRPSGELFQGVDSFLAIWRVLRLNPRMIRFAEFSLVKPFLKAGYHAFALVRPLLPKKKHHDCDSGSCQISLGEKLMERQRAEKSHQTLGDQS